MADHVAQGMPVQLRPIVHGDMLIDERWNRFRGHRIPYWMLYLNSRPGAFVRLDGGRMHPLAPDHVHLIPSWVRFDCHTTRVVPHLWSVFDLVGVPGGLVRELFPTVLSLPLRSNLASGAQRMRQALAAGLPTAATTICAVSAVLYAAACDL